MIKNSSSNFDVTPTFKKITTKDLLGRKKKTQIITKNKTLTSTFIYDKTRVIKEILPDNTIVDYTYLDSGLLSKKTFTKNDEIYESCTYSYDSFHRLIKEIHNKSVTTYQYDEFGNISKTNYQDADNPNVDLVRSYNTYTRLSNIKNTTFSSLKKNTLFEYSTTMPDKMTGVYDKYNQEEEHSYEWDNNRLIKVDDLTFTYNRDGYRIAKKKGTDTTTYKLEGSKVVQLNKNRLVIDFVYDEDDELFAMEYGNQIYYYIKDQTGNIVKIIDETGNTMVEYSYNGWGEVKVIYGSQTSVAALNPFLYKSYLYDVETNLYYIGKRYYDPTLGRFIHYDMNLSLNPYHPNGLNLYIYANNNPISYSYNNVSKKTIPILSSSTIATNVNDIFLLSFIGRATDKTSTNPLSFSVGLFTPEKYDMPSCMSAYVFYAKGTLGWGYTFDDRHSLASFSVGVLDATFHTPKWFSSLSDNHWANPNIYLGFGVRNVNVSVGAGISGTAEIISGTIGIQFGDAISIGVKGYLGIGFTIDFTNGIKFGVGLGFGYEISLNIDWYELFH